MRLLACLVAVTVIACGGEGPASVDLNPCPEEERVCSPWPCPSTAAGCTDHYVCGACVSKPKGPRVVSLTLLERAVTSAFPTSGDAFIRLDAHGLRRHPLLRAEDDSTWQVTTPEGKGELAAAVGDRFGGAYVFARDEADPKRPVASPLLANGTFGARIEQPEAPWTYDLVRRNARGELLLRYVSAHHQRAELVLREPDGRERWRVTTQSWFADAWLDDDGEGRAYAGWYVPAATTLFGRPVAKGSHVFEFAGDGALLSVWRLPVPAVHVRFLGRRADGGLVVAAITAAGPHYVTVLDRDGSVRWHARLEADVRRAVVLAEDGSVLAVHNELTNGNLTLVGLNPDGTPREPVSEHVPLEGHRPHPTALLRMGESLVITGWFDGEWRHTWFGKFEELAEHSRGFVLHLRD